MIDKTQYIYGIHAVLEAIEAGKDIDKIFLSKTLNDETAREISDKARQLRVPVQRVPVQKIDRITRRNHQGVLAMMAAVTYYRVEDLVPQLFDEGENPFIVVLDGVTDVRNFGAVARTCECAGVSAIVIPDRESVSVNADAVKTSAGALNYLPVCREHNLVNAIKCCVTAASRLWAPATSSNCPTPKPITLVLLPLCLALRTRAFHPIS